MLLILWPLSDSFFCHYFSGFEHGGWFLLRNFLKLVLTSALSLADFVVLSPILVYLTPPAKHLWFLLAGCRSWVGFCWLNE